MNVTLHRITEKQKTRKRNPEIELPQQRGMRITIKWEGVQKELMVTFAEIRRKT